MTFLAFDTTVEACSVAVADGGRVLAHLSERRARGHAEALMPMIEAALAEAGRDMASLEGVLVTTGPGTFTGVRIGIAAARGLGLALTARIGGLSTLEALALGALDRLGDGETVLALIDARRGELYAAAYRRSSAAYPLEEEEPPRKLPLSELAGALARHGPAVVVGSGAFRVGETAAPAPRIIPGLEVPDMSAVARLAPHLPAPYWNARPAPIYLRAPDAKLPAGA